MNKQSRTTLFGAIFLSLVGCHAAPSEDLESKPIGPGWVSRDQRRQIELASVRALPVEQLVQAGGVVGFDDSRVGHVFSPLTGRIVKVSAELGQHVKRGDVLAAVQSADLASATSDLAKAEADFSTADHDLKRKRDLWDAHATSRAELEQAEDAFARAGAEQLRARERSALLKSSGTLDTVSMTFSLRSPIDGEVIARNVAPQAEIQGQSGGGASEELFTIGDVSSVWLNLDVFEVDIARVKVGATVRATTLAYPGRTFPGAVAWVAPNLDASSHTVRVRCRVDNPDHALLPAMFVAANIVVGTRNAVTVPAEAAVRASDSTFVFVARAERPDGSIAFERRRVITGEVPGHPELALVQGGVAAGERVAGKGSILLLGLS